jgi:hypothetical protein
MSATELIKQVAALSQRERLLFEQLFHGDRPPIHVAAAAALGVKEFVTFDVRQGAMAKQAGLTVKP